MSESKNREMKITPVKGIKKNAHVVSVNFYGALKSKDEKYFQMASLFKEVTRDEKKLENRWMKKILIENFSDISGKSFINNI
jgi:hypothetical protein